MADRNWYAAALLATSTQATAFEKRARSRAEIQYSAVMQQTAETLAEFTPSATFAQLMEVEKILQLEG